MKNRTKKRKTVGARPSRIDPTRTGSLRRAHAAQLRRQFSALKVSILRFVGDGDAFGLDEQPVVNTFNPSQPRDEKGQWVEGFHGSPNPNLTELKEGEGSQYQRVAGIYFAPKQEDAVKYTKKNGVVTGKVYGARLHLKNPATRKDLDELGYGPNGLEARQALIDKGFDGVIDELMEEIIVFHPHQVQMVNNIARERMPQVRKADWEEFLAFARARTTVTREDSIDPDTLKAVQHEFSQERVDAIPMEKLAYPILVSQDGYVLDGNHRWIKAAQTKTTIPVLRMGLDKTAALAMVRSFPKAEYVENVFCPTGEGGGVDPTCSPSGKSIKENESEAKDLDVYKVSVKGRGVMYAVRDTVANPRGFGDSLHSTLESADKEISLISRKRDQSQELKTKRDLESSKLAAEDAEKKNINGFMDDSTPLQKGRVIETLSKKVRYKGEEVSVRDLIRRKVQEGWKVTEEGLSGPDDVYLRKSVIGGATGQRYAQHLIDKGITTNAGEYRFQPDPEKVKAFELWLQRAYSRILVNVATEQLWQKFIEDGYRRGAGRAFDDVNAAKRAARVAELGQNPKLDFTKETREEFLRSSFGQPISVDRVKMLAGRTFDELKDVTREMSNKISRVLVDGLVTGKGARDVAREMAEVVDIGQVRALRISQHELVKAHAQGQLTSMKKLGVTHLGVAVEWSNSGNPRCSVISAKERKKVSCVCKLCEVLQGIVITLDEAWGLIPRHVGCLCSWKPAVLVKKEQVRDQGSIARAIAKSIADGVPKYKKRDDPDWSKHYADGTGWAAGTRIGKSRPKGVTTNDLADFGASLNGPLERFSELAKNVFCPTGPGGGVDPTCSPSWEKVGGLRTATKLDFPIKDGVKAAPSCDGGFGDCTNQAYLEYKRSGADVYHGYAVPKDRVEGASKLYKSMVTEYGEDAVGPNASGLVATAHAWNVKDGHIVDHAFGSEFAKEHVYFGVKIPKSTLDKLAHGDQIAHDLDFPFKEVTTYH